MALHLDLVGLVVRDMAASLRFYRALGLDIPREADGEAHVEWRTASGLRLAWDTLELIRSIDPGFADPPGGRIALAFLCGSPPEVDERYAALTAQGFHGHKDPYDAFWGQRYAVLHDPDGNPVDLFAPLG
ncbi:MAG TPA: VOC family protein [Deinococcales bacterium]|nr:VOC family protein [Deinococcales bacterium]